MALVTSDLLAATLTNFRTIFTTGFYNSQNTVGWREIAAVMPNPGSAEASYSWLGSVPRMRDVTHTQAQREGLLGYNFTIRSREWQAILEVELAALERDQLGIITPRIQQMSLEAARHPGELILQLVEQNPTLTWEDGEGNSYNLGAYFGSGRVLGNSGDIDNSITYNVSGSFPTIAEFQQGVNDAVAQMYSFKDDQGRPLLMAPNIIMVPPSLRTLAWQALNPSSAGSLDRSLPPATTNGNFSAGGYTVITNPYLTATQDFYVFRSGGPVERPFIYQEETGPRMNGGTNPNEQAVIESRKVIYSAYARYNVAVSDPRFAIAVVAV